MTTYVLVHGAWHGGWAWRGVARALRAAGHEVYTPSLTGLGERAHLLTREVGLQTHVDDIMGLIRVEELDDVVLVGHSYGGRVVAPVADRMPERIAAIVFVDASWPLDGEPGLARFPAERAAKIRDDAKRLGDGWKVPPLRAAFWNVKDPVAAARVDRLCTPHPLRAFEDAISMSGAWQAVTTKVFVLAAEYAGSPFRHYFDQVNGTPGWRTHSVASGHEIMLDQPAELTSILLASSPDAHP